LPAFPWKRTSDLRVNEYARWIGRLLLARLDFFGWEDACTRKHSQRCTPPSLAQTAVFWPKLPLSCRKAHFIPPNSRPRIGLGHGRGTGIPDQNFAQGRRPR